MNLFDDDQDRLLTELNDRVYDALKMTGRDRALVHDLVHVRLELRDGNVGRAAVRPPDTATMRRYGRRLQKELDAFVGDIIPKRHNVNIVHDDMSGMVSVELVQNSKGSGRIAVWRAGGQEAKQLANTRDRLQREYSQWVYFNRDLRIYERNRTCLLKPMQTFHWTESQAMADAGDIIAETMESGAGD
jgi:hypothetical protein